MHIKPIIQATAIAEILAVPVAMNAASAVGSVGSITVDKVDVASDSGSVNKGERASHQLV